MIINSLSPTSKSQCFSLALTGGVKGEWKLSGTIYRTRHYAQDFEETEETISGETNNYKVIFTFFH
jgi:hypothetical protein